MSGVMGIDPSLTGTGLAHWSPKDGWDTGTLVTAGHKTDTYFDMRKRLRRIVDRVSSEVGRFDPDVVVIEYPAYSANMGAATARAGLFWLIADTLLDRWPQTDVGFCDPRNRIKYALGKRSGSKDAVLAAAIKRYPETQIRNSDEADAVLLAALGARWYGGFADPAYLMVDRAPQLCRDAVRSVQWPESFDRM